MARTAVTQLRQQIDGVGREAFAAGYAAANAGDPGRRVAFGAGNRERCCCATPSGSCATGDAGDAARSRAPCS
jgi:hypothetical protein